MDYKELYELLNDRARILVGTLLKRIEVLEEQKALTPSLYKSLVKELVYEQFRTIKTLIKIRHELGKVVFKSKEVTNENS